MIKRATLTLAIALAQCLGACRSGGPAASEAQLSKDFERKVQCEIYASKTEKEYKEFGREFFGEKRSGVQSGVYSVDRILYSRRRNSCVCVLTYTSYGGKGFESVQLLDVLTREQLWHHEYLSDEMGRADNDIDALSQEY